MPKNEAINAGIKATPIPAYATINEPLTLATPLYSLNVKGNG